MTFKLKYNYKIEKYKVFYISNIKSKLLKINDIYILNKIIIF